MLSKAKHLERPEKKIFHFVQNGNLVFSLITIND
jgi:hypothetical protein